MTLKVTEGYQSCWYSIGILMKFKWSHIQRGTRTSWGMLNRQYLSEMSIFLNISRKQMV